MPNETVAEPKTETPPSTPPQEPPRKTPTQTTPNMQFKNKYAIGDNVWVVFNIGPDLKVNQFEVKSINCEVIGFDEATYIYGFTIASDGHGDAVNMRFEPEQKCFRTRDEAEALARTMVGDVIEEYDKTIADTTKKFEEYIGGLNDQKALASATDLTVKDRVVKVPPQSEGSPEKEVAAKIVETPQGEPLDKASEEATDLGLGRGSTPSETKVDPETPVKTPDKE